MRLPQLDWNASLGWFNMASFTSPSWLGSLWLWTGITLHFLSVLSVPICQSRTAGSSSLARSPQWSPTGYLEIEPFVAGSHSIAAATFMQASSSTAMFQHSLWLSLLLRNMGLQLLHVQTSVRNISFLHLPFLTPQSLFTFTSISFRSHRWDQCHFQSWLHRQPSGAQAHQHFHLTFKPGH